VGGSGGKVLPTMKKSTERIKVIGGGNQERRGKAISNPTNWEAQPKNAAGLWGDAFGNRGIERGLEKRPLKHRIRKKKKGTLKKKTTGRSKPVPKALQWRGRGE